VGGLELAGGIADGLAVEVGDLPGEVDGRGVREAGEVGGGGGGLAGGEEMAAGVEAAPEVGRGAEGWGGEEGLAGAVAARAEDGEAEEDVVGALRGDQGHVVGSEVVSREDRTGDGPPKLFSVGVAKGKIEAALGVDES
jgi:hypothetical protein